MSTKKNERFDLSNIKSRTERGNAALPTDVATNGRRLEDYAEIPCVKLCSYRKKDPHDIIDKSDPEYLALVSSIAEKGVYDAIIVRSVNDPELNKQGCSYEILAGHHRVEASIDAGKRYVPARIIRDCTDKDAEDIYRLTNLLRRKQSIRDLAYGWWHFFNVTRYKSEEQIMKLVEEGIVDESLKEVSDSKGNKQLRRYARLHELTDEMIDLVERKAMSIKFAEQISYIDKELQNDLLEYKTNLKGVEKAKRLRNLAEGTEEGMRWSKESIENILFPNSLQSENKKTMTEAEFINALHQYIPKQYQEQEKMLTLIQDALYLYFREHPEEQIAT